MLCTTNERRVYADGSIILQSAAIFKKFLTSQVWGQLSSNYMAVDRVTRHINFIHFVSLFYFKPCSKSLSLFYYHFYNEVCCSNHFFPFHFWGRGGRGEKVVKFLNKLPITEFNLGMNTQSEKCCEMMMHVHLLFLIPSQRNSSLNSMN